MDIDSKMRNRSSSRIYRWNLNERYFTRTKMKKLDISFILQCVPKEINSKNARDSTLILRLESCNVTSFAMQLPVSSICYRKKQKKKRKKNYAHSHEIRWKKNRRSSCFPRFTSTTQFHNCLINLHSCLTRKFSVKLQFIGIHGWASVRIHPANDYLSVAAVCFKRLQRQSRARLSKFSVINFLLWLVWRGPKSNIAVKIPRKKSTSKRKRKKDLLYAKDRKE